PRAARRRRHGAAPRRRRRRPGAHADGPPGPAPLACRARRLHPRHRVLRAGGVMATVVKSIETPLSLEYTHTAGRAPTRFLRGMAQGRILGQRCPECRKVYVPPRGSCPRCGVPTEEEVEVSGKGTVTTFCIVRIPSDALSVDPPFTCA